MNCLAQSGIKSQHALTEKVIDILSSEKKRTKALVCLIGSRWELASVIGYLQVEPLLISIYIKLCKSSRLPAGHFKRNSGLAEWFDRWDCNVYWGDIWHTELRALVIIIICRGENHLTDVFNQINFIIFSSTFQVRKPSHHIQLPNLHIVSAGVAAVPTVSTVSSFPVSKLSGRADWCWPGLSCGSGPAANCGSLLGTPELHCFVRPPTPLPSPLHSSLVSPSRPSQWLNGNQVAVLALSVSHLEIHKNSQSTDRVVNKSAGHYPDKSDD